MGVTDELSCISPCLLLAVRVAVQEQLSLPRAAGSLLPSRNGPQNPTGDAPGISPSCCSSPPDTQPLALPSAASAEQPQEMGQKEFCRESPAPRVGEQPKALPLAHRGTATAARRQSSPKTWATPAARAPWLPAPGSAASAPVAPSHLGSPVPVLGLHKNKPQTHLYALQQRCPTAESCRAGRRAAG